MDKLKAWLQEKKNLPIVAVATGIVIVAAALFFMKQAGIIGGGGPQMAETYPLPAETPTTPGGLPDAWGEAPPLTPADEAAGPSPTAAPAAAPGAGEAPAAKLSPMLPYRKDPFLPFGGVPKKEDVLAALLPSISRVRIAPARVARAGQIEIPEVLPPQPFRRMAGVLWNGRVSAILETDGEVDIVRPGQEISKGNSKVRVESIEPQAIILKTLDTREPMTIRVSMAGSVAAREAATGETGTTGGGAREGVPPPPPTYY